jgi:hypothetical protein
VTIGYLSTLIRAARYVPADPGASLSRPVEDALIARLDAWLAAMAAGQTGGSGAGRMA